MATFKKLASRVRAFNRDEQGAAGAIEMVGAVAVGVLILAVIFKMVGSDHESGGDNTIIGLIWSNIKSLFDKGSAGSIGKQ
jgi:hypothetical protein